MISFSEILKKKWHHIKKVKRAKRIKKAKSKIAPYLQKDFGVELNYKLWTTKGSRFLASERNVTMDSLSSKTIGYLSAYLIIVNLITIYKLPILGELTINQLGFTTTAFSILILIFSQFEGAKNHSLRAEKFHQCGLEIGELYNKLRMVKTFDDVNNPQEKIENISENYDAILKKYENHSAIDFLMFKTTKPDYFGLTWRNVRGIKIKRYFIVKFKYHLMIYGPFLVFIAYEVGKYFSLFQK